MGRSAAPTVSVACDQRFRYVREAPPYRHQLSRLASFYSEARREPTPHEAHGSHLYCDCGQDRAAVQACQCEGRRPPWTRVAALIAEARQLGPHERFSDEQFARGHLTLPARHTLSADSAFQLSVNVTLSLWNLLVHRVLPREHLWLELLTDELADLP